MASSSSIIELSGEGIIVHPCAVMGILEHYKRRQQDDGFVLGALVGSQVDLSNQFEIVDVVQVPHTVDSKGFVKLDTDYLLKRKTLLHAVEQAHRIIGWYVTASTKGAPGFPSLLQVNASLFSIIPQSIHAPLVLTVDTNLSRDSLHLRAFWGRFLSPEDSPQPSLVVFEPATVSISNLPEEAAALDVLINSIPTERDVFDASAAMLSQKEGLEVSIENMKVILEKILLQLESSADPVLSRKVSNMIQSIPSTELFVQHIKGEISNGEQDLLMVNYLTGLVKAQTLLADHIDVV